MDSKFDHISHNGLVPHLRVLLSSSQMYICDRVSWSYLEPFVRLLSSHDFEIFGNISISVLYTQHKNYINWKVNSTMFHLCKRESLVWFVIPEKFVERFQQLVLERNGLVLASRYFYYSIDGGHVCSTNCHKISVYMIHQSVVDLNKICGIRCGTTFLSEMDKNIISEINWASTNGCSWIERGGQVDCSDILLSGTTCCSSSFNKENLIATINTEPSDIQVDPNDIKLETELNEPQSIIVKEETCKWEDMPTSSYQEQNFDLEEEPMSTLFSSSYYRLPKLLSCPVCLSEFSSMVGRMKPLLNHINNCHKGISKQLFRALAKKYCSNRTSSKKISSGVQRSKMYGGKT